MQNFSRRLELSSPLATHYDAVWRFFPQIRRLDRQEIIYVQVLRETLGRIQAIAKADTYSYIYLYLNTFKHRLIYLYSQIGYIHLLLGPPWSSLPALLTAIEAQSRCLVS